MKTFKQRLMLVATLMVIAVSGYAAEKTWVPLLTTNFDDGNLGNWQVWGNEPNPSNLDQHIGFGETGFDNKGKCLELTNPSGTAFHHAQLAYEFSENLVPSKEYTIKFWVKCENGNSQLQFQYQHHEGDTYNPQGGYQTIDITGDWQHIERKVTIANDHANINRIIINFGKDQKTFYIDDIEFGSYEEVQDNPGSGSTPETKPVTPTGSLNNTMYYDGTQWCLMLEDFEGETIGYDKGFKHEYDWDDTGKATVAADPLGNPNKSLNFINGNNKSGDYYYIDVTLPDSKTLSSFTNLIFDVVYNTTGDNGWKDIKVNIGETSTDTSTNLGQFKSENADTKSWSQQKISLTSLTDEYKNLNAFRIYIGGFSSNHTNMFIDNIRLSVNPTTSGNCGKTNQTDAGWMLDGNTLYISGTGDIADYEESSSKLWSDNKDNISNVIIGEGITAIGTNNFFEHNKLESVVLPSTLKQIGSKGLYASNGNKKIEFTFHSNPTMADKALHENSDSYTATLVLDDALSPFFAAKSDNTFNGGIQYKRKVSAEKSTITLPFTPKSGSENCKFYKLSSASEDNLTFEEVSKTNLVAGNPYIMVMTEPNEINFSTDESITILAKDSVASKTTSSPWTMHGTYSTLVINSESCKDNAYGFTGNYLKKNTGNMTVKPFRAYFTTPSTTAKDYLNVLFGGEVTGIERNEFSPEGITEIFSLDGKKHDCLQKGMNIVKMNNGSIKKIVIK
ncbi:MAG: carbohydrate binding domain-containing protein [Prevotella sp.]|nr:carbohydrate binding domain-containing protein [Prevotella sp.]